MPAIGFVCPNGEHKRFEECMGDCPSRCMALPALKSAATQRNWTGKPSVTQLLKPTRQTFLEITKEYYISPMNGIAAMIGTNSHKAFEDNVPNNWMAEVRLENDIVSGQFDAYDCKNGILWDWKFFGAYRIARAIGMTSKWQKRVIKRGKDKGKEKWEQVFVSGGVRDVMDIAKQLSYYKVLMEDNGLTVNAINVNMFVRGGIDATAKKYGITQAGYIVPIHPISRHWVERYFQHKHRLLMEALENNVLPPVCSKKDRWDSSKSYPQMP